MFPAILALQNPEIAETAEVITQVAAEETSGAGHLILLLTVFVLAVFLGFEIITKIPPTLHTPVDVRLECDFPASPLSERSWPPAETTVLWQLLSVMRPSSSPP